MDNELVHFRHGTAGALPRILGYSLAFHVAVILALVAWFWLKPEPKIEKIQVFELVPVTMPPPAPKPALQPQPTPPVPVQPEQPQPKPEPKPISKPDPVLPNPTAEPTPQPRPESAPVSEPVSPISTPQPPQMDLPDFGVLQNLRTVESIMIDPLMQVYLERLQVILMQNFNPPGDIDIFQGAITTVQFTISRNGQITDILLKRSSGRGAWDRLAMRAVTLSKVPPLPPNYRAPFLPLVFDFKEK